MSVQLRGGALAPVARVALGLAILALLVMAGAQFWQVVARYVLNNSPGWTEPVALLCMNTAMMCGAAVAVREGRHFSFTLILDAVRPSVARVLRTFNTLLVTAVGAGLAAGGAVLAMDDWPIQMAGAPLPEGLRYVPLCLGGSLIAVFALERLWAPAVAPVQE